MGRNSDDEEASPIKRARTLKDQEVNLHEADATGSSLCRIATRGLIGATLDVGAIIQKNGIHTLRSRAGQLEETLAVGGACSEVFSGPQLAKVLQPAVDQQTQALKELLSSRACIPLSIHTSVGLPLHFGSFIKVLEAHLPWTQDCDDWFVNLQLEGTTAVWAGVEALMRLREVEKRACQPYQYVAVAECSYHGPKSTGLGKPACARWPGAPRTEGQIAYPLPSPRAADSAEEREKYVQQFKAFLAEHGEMIGVIIFEPQWGSSFAGRPWPKNLLQEIVGLSRAVGILVLCDEIMCGLGRHGQGTLFLSKAWDLNPDAVTFGKAIAAGAYPMSGVALRRGAASLNSAGVKMMQSHTYAGSSSLALITASEVLKELPRWFQHAADMGRVIQEVLQPVSAEGFLRIEGQGLMWGGLFTDPDADRRKRSQDLFVHACSNQGVWPYFVPAGGFMLTPPMDVKEEDLRKGLLKLSGCVTEVKDQLD